MTEKTSLAGKKQRENEKKTRARRKKTRERDELFFLLLLFASEVLNSTSFHRAPVKKKVRRMEKSCSTTGTLFLFHCVCSSFLTRSPSFLFSVCMCGGAFDVCKHRNTSESKKKEDRQRARAQERGRKRGGKKATTYSKPKTNGKHTNSLSSSALVRVKEERERERERNKEGKEGKHRSEKLLSTEEKQSRLEMCVCDGEYVQKNARTQTNIGYLDIFSLLELPSARAHSMSDRRNVTNKEKNR